ncbi:MAG: glycosyltransferase [Prevotella sp.]
MKYDIATIVVNYKTEERTIEFVTSELPKCGLRQLVVVVNNGATQESSEILAESLNAPIIEDVHLVYIEVSDSSVYIIHNEENTGFARGNNLGVEFVKHHFDVDYLLFSNNDIRLNTPDTIERLIEKLETLPDVGIIGPKVVGLDGHCQSPNDYVPFWKEMVGVPWERFIPFLHLKHINQDKAEEGYYFRVMGSFFLMKYEDFINCGMMDPNTFLFYEEAILSERLKLINKRVYYYPIAEVLHDHGLSINKACDTMGKRDYLFESAVYFFTAYKNIPYINILTAKCLHYIYRNLQNAKRRI